MHYRFIGPMSFVMVSLDVFRMTLGRKQTRALCAYRAKRIFQFFWTVLWAILRLVVFYAEPYVTEIPTMMFGRTSRFTVRT